MIIKTLVLSLQLELNDLIYEKGLEQCPVLAPYCEMVGFIIIVAPPWRAPWHRKRWGKTHVLPWMGLLLTVCHSDDPASREYM